MSVGDTLTAVGKALAKHADKLPTILRLGEALWKATKGDEKAALAAIRQIELERRRSRDRRMGRP